jgi:hypothetical protein
MFTFLSTSIQVCYFGVGACFMIVDAANRVTTSSLVVLLVCIEFVDQKKDHNVRRGHAGVINATDTVTGGITKGKLRNERDRGTGRVTCYSPR